MTWNVKSSRKGQAHRRPDLEALEVRQLLSLTDPVPAASSSASSFVRANGTVDFDQVIQASSARATYNVDGTGSNVAVIDTGVDYTNPAFGAGTVGQLGDKIVAGIDFTGSPNGIMPTWQHGTGVAGLIASTDPSSPGVAPGAGIVALRVFGDDNTGSFDRIAQALNWVITNHDQYHITAVNMSVSDGGNYLSNEFAADGSVGEQITDAVKTLDNLNIPVVVAAGNAFDGKTQGEGFASIIPDTISVTATDETKMGSKGADPLASDAQRLGAGKGGASATDIAAPGVDLNAPSGHSGTATEEGTSFATPQVTGTVVLLQEMYQKAYGTLPTVTQLDGWLQAGADTIHDNATGIDIGRLNVAGSLKILNNQIQSTETTTVAATPVINPVAETLAPVTSVVAVTPTTPPVATTPVTTVTSTTTAPTTTATTDTSISTSTAKATEPTTEVFVNGASVGNIATSQLAGAYGRLFALTNGVARNLRVWSPAGSTVDLGTSKPTGSVAHPKTVGTAARAHIRPAHHSTTLVVHSVVVSATSHRTRSPAHTSKLGTPSVTSI